MSVVAHFFLQNNPDDKIRKETEDLIQKCKAALPKDESLGHTFSYAHGKRKEWVETEEDKAKRYGIGI